MIFLDVKFRVKMPVYPGFIAIGSDDAFTPPPFTSKVLNAISNNTNNELIFVQDFTNFPSTTNNEIYYANKIEYKTNVNQLIAAMPTYQTDGPGGVGTNNSSLVFTTSGSTSTWADTSGVVGFDTTDANTSEPIIMRKGYFDGSDNSILVAVNNGSATNTILYNKNDDLTTSWASINGVGSATIDFIRTMTGRPGNDNWIVVTSGSANGTIVYYKSGTSTFSVEPSFNTAWMANSTTYASGFGKVGPSALDGWLLAGNTTDSGGDTNSLAYTTSLDGSGGWTAYGGSLFKISTARWNPRCMATDGSNNWVIGYTASNDPNFIGMIYSNNYGQTFTNAVVDSSVPASGFACYGLAYGTIGTKNYFVASGQMVGSAVYSILWSDDGGATWYAVETPYSEFTSQGFDVIFTNMDVVCLLKGSKVKTPEGYVAIETLSKGDTVLMPNGLERGIVDIPHQTVPNEPHLAPYIIPAGKLGASEDLYLSPTHSVFIDGKFIEAQFLGYKRASLPGKAIEYYNISLGGFRDELLDAQGVQIESLGKPFKGAENLFHEKVAIRSTLPKDALYPEDVRNGLIAKLQKESPYTVSELQNLSDQELRYILLGDNVDIL
jgi:hypothetical protein